jgi:hypothetical protein
MQTTSQTGHLGKLFAYPGKTQDGTLILKLELLAIFLIPFNVFHLGSQFHLMNGYRTINTKIYRGYSPKVGVIAFLS